MGSRHESAAAAAAIRELSEQLSKKEHELQSTKTELDAAKETYATEARYAIGSSLVEWPVGLAFSKNLKTFR